VDEPEAIEIAKRTIATRETWADRASYEARRHGDGWFVGVWRLSHTPDGKRLYEFGGHRGIVIDREGNVVEYRGR
jgi:hypothetical protein